MPISLALVREDGRELYLEFVHDEDKARAHDFVRANVLPHLAGQEQYTKPQAAERITHFLGLGPKHPAESRSPVEIWAYFADYDWMLFCQIFGTMDQLPAGCPMLCMDLEQWWIQLGRPPGVKPPKPARLHHALADADWNRAFHARLEDESQAGRRPGGNGGDNPGTARQNRRDTEQDGSSTAPARGSGELDGPRAKGPASEPGGGAPISGEQDG
jgi:hypothetical protein